MSASTPAMSDPLQQQPPPMSEPQMLHSDPGRGSVGPVIGVLAVIALLGAIAVMIGRICSGRRVMGRGKYDFESWVEGKCGSCIDGRADPPQPQPPPPPPPPREVVEIKSDGSSADAPAAAAEAAGVGNQHERA